jgi:acyl carrier protein
VTADEILHTVEKLAHDHLEWSGPVTPEMDLIEDLQLDSLKLLTLAVQVENHFQICFEPEEEAEIRRVSDLVSVVDRKLSAKAGD